MKQSPLDVFLIHGAWQGAWVWEKFIPYLEEAGFSSVAVDLPGNGKDDTAAGAVSLHLYVRHMLDLIGTVDRPVAIIAHSGGGVVASQLAQEVPEKIAAIVYVAGMMLPDGTGYGDLVAGSIAEHPEVSGIGPHLVWSDDRLTSRVPKAAAIRHFLNDVPLALAEQAAERLTPQPEGGRDIRPRITPERFGSVPRLYVEATGDQSVALLLQRRMQALVPGAETASLPTGHAPHVSAPAALANVVIPFLNQVNGRS
ncbi:MAG: alpha/beta fold hydrolase [Allorhizobium sp.]